MPTRPSVPARDAVPLPTDYPQHCERRARTRDGVEFLIRPIRPDDMQREMEFLRGMSGQTRYNRLMYSVNEPTEASLRPLLNIDYRRQMALIALDASAGRENIIAVVRYGSDPTGPDCEFAVVVTDAWQGRGVATELLTDLFAYARKLGLKRLYGIVLSGNKAMLQLSRSFGLEIHSSTTDSSLMTVSRTLATDNPSPD